MMKNIGYCGLDCEKCDAYKATVENNDFLREKTAKLWSELNNAVITADMINCTGCRCEGVKTPFCECMCPIRNCAKSNGYSNCGMCPESSQCAKLSPITENNAEAFENIKEAKGLSNAENDTFQKTL